MSDTTPRRRAPAFQFYADDFLAGTLDLSQAEVGAYIRLLCHQWNRGSIPVDVLAKFRLHEDGTLKNERLEAVRAASDAFRDKQAEKGRKSAEKRANMANRGSTAVQPGGQPNGQPEANSPSPSPLIPPIPPQRGETQTPLKLENEPPPPPKPDPRAGFALFWQAYPKKTNQPTAKRAWLKLKPDADLARRIVEDVQARRNSFDWTKDSGQFIPNPGTYLNGRRWDDAVETLAPVAKPEPKTAAEHETKLGRPLTWAERQALEAGIPIA